MTIWFLSDHHFGHENLLTFHDDEGKKLREFPSIEAHDLMLVESHNKVVRDSDHVYFMGDVAMKFNEYVMMLLRMMRGKKRLLRGNHDIAKTRLYTRFFEEIHATRIFNNLIFSHIPLHPESLGRFRGNVHGHVHANTLSDPRYLNMCPENVGYVPLSLEEISERFKGS